MATPDEDTTQYSNPGAGGARPASRHDIPVADTGAILAQILHNQERQGRELTWIREQLAKGSSTLEASVKTGEDMQAVKVEMAEFRTKMSLLLWILGVVATCSIGALVAALFALILRAPPAPAPVSEVRLGEAPPYYAMRE